MKNDVEDIAKDASFFGLFAMIRRRCDESNEEDRRKATVIFEFDEA